MPEPRVTEGPLTVGSISDCRSSENAKEGYESNSTLKFASARSELQPASSRDRNSTVRSHQPALAAIPQIVEKNDLDSIRALRQKNLAEGLVAKKILSRPPHGGKLKLNVKEKLAFL